MQGKVSIGINANTQPKKNEDYA